MVQKQVSRNLGTENIPISIIGIESKVFTIVGNLVVGIVLGCQPITSYNMDYFGIEGILFAVLIAAALTLTFMRKLKNADRQRTRRPSAPSPAAAVPAISESDITTGL